MKDYYFPDGKTPFVEIENLGVLDILVWSTFGSYKVQEEIFGIKVIDPEKYPLIFSWVTALNEVPFLKELSPPHERLLALFLSVRNKSLELASAAGSSG